jgi:hypothetical protein
MENYEKIHSFIMRGHRWINFINKLNINKYNFS